jgi:adenosylcobinamide-GDP ribazoletransferase
MADHWIAERLTELRIGAIFLTRLPIPHGPPVERGELARALWTAPVFGAVVGAIGAGVYALAYALNLPPLAAATLAIVATAGVTGALHEDGLADVADGFGGGATRERKLEIMRDSRIGTFGVLALLLSVLLRVGALAGLEQPGMVAAALIAAGSAARAGLPAFMAIVPPARPDGMSAHAGTPPNESAMVAAALGALALVLALGLGPGLIALICFAGAGAILARLCIRQIGGQTGDVLGALEQTGEVAILLVAVAALS